MALRLEIVLQDAQLQTDVVKAELAQRVYRNMVAAGIFTDSATKNRVLNDVTSFLDTATLATLKSLDDGFGVLELAALSVNKAASESISVSDVLTRQVTYLRQFTDAVAIDDAFDIAQNHSQTNNNVTFVNDVSDFAFTHPEAETISLVDAHNLELEQVQTDTVSAPDVATVIHYLGEGKIFNRPLFNQSTFG